jgi:hypothetical protein
MRLVVILIVIVFLLGCTHPGIYGGGRTSEDPCSVYEPCSGAGGSAGDAVSIAVGSAIVGAVALAMYRKLVD